MSIPSVTQSVTIWTFNLNKKLSVIELLLNGQNFDDYHKKLKIDLSKIRTVMAF